MKSSLLLVERELPANRVCDKSRIKVDIMQISFSMTIVRCMQRLTCGEDIIRNRNNFIVYKYFLQIYF